MKPDIHPKWFSEATVVCACGNTWKTGATIAEIRTDICSACHPFYTGEQRIVDTEGQVDRFLKRLQVRDSKRAEVEAKQAALVSPEAAIQEFDIGKRYLNVLVENGIKTAGDVLTKLQEGGDDAMIAISGFGRKQLSDLKKLMRARGYQLPGSDTETSDAV